ncbi:MAG: Rieske 2Fe-2S domain-containing protein [Candidatus Thioglobus sp.]|nr:Rieske 2Fe-2S domain-containing protein [Candidatus Thioglobus sp.]
MWIKALENSPQEGTMLEFNAAGKQLFVTLNNGKLYCGENHCPHEGVKLTLGCFKGNRIKCSLHGFSFDLATGSSSEDGVDDLKTYPVKQQNGQIYINL